MEERREYEVLKLTRHGERCYLSTETVRGMPLVRWLKHHTLVSKEQVYRWFGELAEQLACFHETKEHTYYQYLNPYSVIVAEDDAWHLLDLAREGQENLLRIMQRRLVRENFLAPDNQYYQKPGMKADLYGVGKLIQYVLSVAAVEPKIGRIEERRLQAVISKCLDQDEKKNFRDMKEFSEAFAKISTHQTKKNTGKAGKIAVVVAAGVLAVLSCAVWHQEKEANDRQVQMARASERSESDQKRIRKLQDDKERVEQEKELVEEQAYERERTLLYELALLAFREESYARCHEYLEELAEKDPFAKDLDTLCAYMGKEREPESARDLELMLERMEKTKPDPEDRRYDYCLLKGYGLLEHDEAKEKLRILAKQCVDSEEWTAWAGESVSEEVAKLCEESETEEQGFGESEDAEPTEEATQAEDGSKTADEAEQKDEEK